VLVCNCVITSERYLFFQREKSEEGTFLKIFPHFSTSLSLSLPLSPSFCFLFQSEETFRSGKRTTKSEEHHQHAAKRTHARKNGRRENIIYIEREKERERDENDEENFFAGELRIYSFQREKHKQPESTSSSSSSSQQRFASREDYSS
jgi:hypothetical protein